MSKQVINIDNNLRIQQIRQEHRQINKMQVNQSHNLTIQEKNQTLASQINCCSIESLLRYKQWSQAKLRQIQVQLQSKQFCQQQLSQKCLQNRQENNKLVSEFLSFKSNMQKINRSKQLMIQSLNKEVSLYRNSEQNLLKAIDQYEENSIRISQENIRLKKQLLQKNKFIQCYFKGKQQLRKDTTKREIRSETRTQSVKHPVDSQIDRASLNNGLHLQGQHTEIHL